ncbi:MAG TPA: type II toxin-antitoxin system prevent-host-death family antitoxin [Rhabdochlamydiaceae bacterium]|nr:type II toxin-antitoxin system prevent-host-death family antitoxin [Rhabdochlamydiaceae bacterium]
MKIDVYDAKIHFSKLINSAVHGNEVLITIAGKPVAKLVPIGKKSQRRFGVLKGKIKIAKDFDAPLPNEFLNI